MPTTPRTEAEIETVFGDAQKALPAGSIREEWGRFAAFLKRPALRTEHAVGAPATVLARIYTLDMLAMLTLIMAASSAVAMGLTLPQTALAGIEFTPLIIWAVIVIAPVSEELIFRGWLSGRPSHIIGLLFAGAGVGTALSLQQSAPVIGVVMGFAGLAAAAAALIILRHRPAFGWFARFFPAFFWLATLAFALVHLANFDEGSLAVLLPLVLPQFILGSLLGYVRVRIGLWAAITLHAAHNATAIGIAALAGGLQAAG